MAELKVYTKPIKKSMLGTTIVSEAYYLKYEADKVIAELEKENAELKEERRWRKCSEEPPPKGKCVLVADEYSLEDSVTMARLTKGSWELNGGALLKKDWFKYWRPLPKAPEVK